MTIEHHPDGVALITIVDMVAPRLPLTFKILVIDHGFRDLSITLEYQGTSLMDCLDGIASAATPGAGSKSLDKLPGLHSAMTNSVKKIELEDMGIIIDIGYDNSEDAEKHDINSLHPTVEAYIDVKVRTCSH